MLVFLQIFWGSNLELKMETYEPIANNMLEFIMISFFIVDKFLDVLHHKFSMRQINIENHVKFIHS
jgi:hypothetical protein